MAVKADEAIQGTHVQTMNQVKEEKTPNGCEGGRTCAKQTSVPLVDQAEE